MTMPYKGAIRRLEAVGLAAVLFKGEPGILGGDEYVSEGETPYMKGRTFFIRPARGGWDVQLAGPGQLSSQAFFKSLGLAVHHVICVRVYGADPSLTTQNALTTPDQAAGPPYPSHSDD